MGAERWDDQVGSVADEASRLLESLRRAAAEATEPTEPTEPTEHSDPDAGATASRPASPSASGSARSGMPDAGPSGEQQPASAPAHDPFCAYCPLCRGAAVVRSLSPDTLARLADLATTAASVLTELAASRAGGAPTASGRATDDSASGGAPATHDGPATRPSRAAPAPSRPIEVRDADDPHEPDDPHQEAPRG